MASVSSVRVVWCVTAFVLAPLVAEGRGPSQTEVLARAARRVLQYQADLPHLIATETSEQIATPPPGTRAAVIEVQKRELVSELGWVSAGTLPDLVGVRDVIEVDGRPLHEGERSRLQLLLHGSEPTTPDGVTELLNEGARYNLAEGSRNFNLPTVALFFLHPETQVRFKWSRKPSADASTWVLAFKERAQPTIIHTGDGEPVFSKGLVEIEVATGEVRRTELTVHIDKLDYTLTTIFRRVASMNMVLPVRLEEKYVMPSGTVTGTASYDTYRRFGTTARLVQ